MPLPKSKKPKVDLEDLARKVWEHYRNYLDSLAEDDLGDIDELQELIDLASPHVKAAASTGNKWKTVTDLLPLLLSVSYYHLADVAIGQYLMQQQQVVEDVQEQAEETQQLITKSLEFYPENAATWSMGANFGRMSHRLSLATARGWYERAVEFASKLRKPALEILDDESIEDPLVKEWVELLVLNHVLGVELEGDDDGDDEEEENEENEENTDEEYSSSAVEATSRFMCSMLLSMEGQHDRALTHLKNFPLTHRLHPNVWAISDPPSHAPATKAPLVFRPEQGILPEALCQPLMKLFAPTSAYWVQSDYSSRGYYSYFVDYENDMKPQNLLDDVIVNHLLPRAKQALSESEASEICGFEWWVHTRPIQANLGHNLHFDTDESMLAQEGKVTHPILSSVLYLTGGGEDDPAGATIILDQTPDSETVADCCWQSVPKDNSFMLFPGNLLHGVLPCPGHQVNETQNGNKETDEQLIQGWKEAPTDEKSPKSNRLTLMVGFWTRNVPETMKERHLYGPCGPLPPATDEHTWVHEIAKGYENKSKGSEKAEAIMPALSLSRVTPAWESIEPDHKDAVVPPLIIPHAIDHRFFVKDAPQCFRNSLFEDREGEC